MEQEINPVQNPNPVNPQLPQKHLHPGIWVATLMVTASIVGYLVWANASKEWPFEEDSQPSNIAINQTDNKSQSQAMDEKTRDWETYISQEHRFEFKYPRNLGDPIVQSSSYAYYITFTNRRGLNLAIDNPPYYSFGTDKAEAVVSSISKNIISKTLQDTYPYYSKILNVDGKHIFVGGDLLCGPGGCNSYLTYHLLLERGQGSYSILTYSSSNLFEKYKNLIGGDYVVLDLLRKYDEDDIVRSKAKIIFDYIVLHNEAEKIYEPLLSTFKFLD